MSENIADTVSSEPAPLELRGVVKRYGALTAVDGVSLTVRPGEIFALLGPNGAGKTTLIHCIAGLTRCTGGEIRVFGHDPARDYRLTRRLVGLVPQEINFDPFFTPLESILNQMGFMGVRPDRARAEELLRMFALWKRRDAYTRQLSGGMKRRLLLAKALAHRPRLLFLDEPTAGVDVALRRDLWAVVRQLRDAGTTIILTTHYLEEAEELADRIGVIHHGRLLLVEEREALLRRYQQGWLRLTLPPEESVALTELPPGTRYDEGGALVIPWSSASELEQILHAVRQRCEPEDLRFEQTHLEDIFIKLVQAADERP